MNNHPQKSPWIIHENHLPDLLISARTTHSHPAWLHKCSSKDWRRTWRCAQRPLQARTFCFLAMSLLEEIMVQTCFFNFFLGHVQRYFLDIRFQNLCFVGLDFGEYLRKWEIRPTAMTSEVRSHKNGKRNWSEAIGIEATHRLLTYCQLYEQNWE